MIDSADGNEKPKNKTHHEPLAMGTPQPPTRNPFSKML